MSNPIIQHALANVWCAPEQDAQAIIQPARITHSSGVFGRVTVMWSTISLPTERDFYHVYSLGDLATVLVNLPRTRGQWLNLATIAHERNVHVQLYNKRGILYPCSLAWLYIMDNTNVIVAIENRNNIDWDFTNEKLYFRVYSNAYFFSKRWRLSKSTSMSGLTVYGGVVGRDFTVPQFKNRLAELEQKDFGVTKFYHNGKLITRVPSGYVSGGDTLEFIHDRSIRRVRQINFFDLHEFTSQRSGDEGGKAKHVIPPDEHGDTIEYYDDIDFHLVRNQANIDDLAVGVYYHRNEAIAVRMLTHNAYSIAGQHVNSFVLDNPDIFDNNEDVEVRMYVRESGWQRELIHDGYHIRQLYKLDLDQIEQAMGTTGNEVTEWQAGELEQNDYTRLMGSDPNNIDKTLVANAYGYHTLTRIMSQSVHQPQGSGSSRYVTRPPGMSMAAVFTYNLQGHLVGWSSHLAGETIHVPASTQAKVVELLDGRLHDSGNDYYGWTLITTNESVRKTGFRCYVAPMINGSPDQSQWTDVTDDDTYFTVSEDGKEIQWNDSELDLKGEYPATRIGGRVVFYQVPLNEDYPGYVRFDVNVPNRWKLPSKDDDSSLSGYPITIPYGQMDIFMDGQLLVEDVDYIVDWPTVTIVKKVPRTPADGLQVHVRCTGFADSNLNRYRPDEIGFVKDGMLSDNDQYNIYDARNLRISVGGSFKQRHQVRLAEDEQGPDLENGNPYAIQNVLAPVERYLDRNTNEFYEQAVAFDQTVGNYLNQYISTDSAETPIILEGLYQLYSPFTSKLIHDLLDGWLNSGELDGDYTPTDIDNWLEQKGTKDLLPFDPAIHPVDTRFVNVRAHHYDTTMTLSIEQYNFVQRCVDLYLNDKVDLTPFITVG